MSFQTFLALFDFYVAEYYRIGAEASLHRLSGVHGNASLVTFLSLTCFHSLTFLWLTPDPELDRQWERLLNNTIFLILSYLFQPLACVVFASSQWLFGSSSVYITMSATISYILPYPSTPALLGTSTMATVFRTFYYASTGGVVCITPWLPDVYVHSYWISMFYWYIFIFQEYFILENVALRFSFL
jgi:hypothetical protein